MPGILSAPSSHFEVHSDGTMLFSLLKKLRGNWAISTPLNGKLVTLAGVLTVDRSGMYDSNGDCTAILRICPYRKVTHASFA